MKKIEQKMLNAIKQGKHWSEGNTSVSFVGVDNPTWIVYLHNSAIAWQSFDDTGTEYIAFSFCRYDSLTTRSRLNAILQNAFSGKVFQKAGNTYFHQWPQSEDMKPCLLQADKSYRISLQDFASNRLQEFIGIRQTYYGNFAPDNPYCPDNWSRWISYWKATAKRKEVEARLKASREYRKAEALDYRVKESIKEARSIAF